MRGSCHALTVGAGLNVHHHRLCARRGGRVRRLRAGTWRFSRPAPADRADDHHLVEFITDYLRMMVSGNMNPLEIENLMDQEIDTHHHEAMAPSHALQKAGDGLPAFGIVAAVMGVVKTMASVGQPPAILGEMIAAALVGTFLGILISYGFVGPLAQVLEQKCDEATKELHCVKATLLASLQGYAPAVAVEFGRKILYSTERPTFLELERHVRQER